MRTKPSFPQLLSPTVKLPPEALTDAASVRSTNHPAESPRMIIGPYKLLQQLGEGGMGNVWMAEQSEPVRRLVALKVIKPGMDSAAVLARFEVERQALALMEHPNIARVSDAGTTPSGRPYFVMEMVKGVPITRYCDELRLTIPERLELFDVKLRPQARSSEIFPCNNLRDTRKFEH